MQTWNSLMNQLHCPQFCQPLSMQEQARMKAHKTPWGLAQSQAFVIRKKTELLAKPRKVLVSYVETHELERASEAMKANQERQDHYDELVRTYGKEPGQIVRDLEAAAALRKKNAQEALELDNYEFRYS